MRSAAMRGKGMFSQRFALPLCIAAACACSSLHSQQNPPPITQESTAVWTDKPPVIDGKLDEDVWKKAPAVTDFRISDGGGVRAKNQTSVRILYDASSIYFGFEVFNVMDGILSAKKPEKFTEHDAWMLDGLEWYLSPNDPGNYYFFCICPLGIRADLHFGGYEDDPFEWNGKWTAQARLLTDHWIVEAAVPFSDVSETPPQPGDTWLTNFARTNSIREANEQLTALNPKYSGFHYLGVKLIFVANLAEKAE